MLSVLLCMLSGAIIGFLFKKKKVSFLNELTLTLVWLLLFLLGLKLGVNETVIRNFASLGLEAVVLAVFATLGSLFGAKLLWNSMQQDRLSQRENVLQQKQENDKRRNSFAAGFRELSGSVVILLFFAVGFVLGFSKVLPSVWLNNDADFFVLCALMFAVGFSLGSQPGVVKPFRRIHSRALLLPLSTVVGTWLGVAVVSFFFNHSLSECLAVGSGFGYYSLSGILITQYKGVELGTIALLSNIVREILTLLFAPLMVRYFGNLSPIAAGAATTMDTTFPVIVRSAGKEWSVVSVYNGFVMDFSVPFLVTLWCGLAI